MDKSKSVPATESVRTNQTAPTKNIVDTVIAAGDFTTFAAGLRAAGLIDALAAKGPFTVFAPTDAAFKKLASGSYDALLKDSAKLAAVLNYHVVKGHFRAADMKAGEQMTLHRRLAEYAWRMEHPQNPFSALVAEINRQYPQN
jgi:uncharacterized surface protein with fasciclin (FAS1) repeats